MEIVLLGSFISPRSIELPLIRQRRKHRVKFHQSKKGGTLPGQLNNHFQDRYTRNLLIHRHIQSHQCCMTIEYCQFWHPLHIWGRWEPPILQKVHHLLLLRVLEQLRCWGLLWTTIFGLSLHPVLPMLLLLLSGSTAPV